jgi:N-acetylglutamate synthase-like GNAT family acetyltransferase
MSAVPAMMYRSASHGRTVKVRPAASARPVTIVSAMIVVRSAVTADVEAIHRLIVDHAVDGRLLTRSLDEVAAHIHRFAVAVQGKRLIGCADLAPLSTTVAEVRSLVVDADARANGVGRKLLDVLTARAERAGFDMLCAFTHSPAYFVHAGFSVVPHTWVPEKIDRDCRGCAQFRRCGQHAVVLPLGEMISGCGRADLKVGLYDVDIEAADVNG